LSTAEGRVNALNAVAPIVGQIRDKSLRPEYIRLLAGWLGVEVETVSTAVGRAGQPSPQEQNALVADSSWRPNPSEPRLALEREVLKARLQMPDLLPDWADIESDAFTHPAYRHLRALIDEHADSQARLDQTEDERMKALIAELFVEPIRTDGEISTRYVQSIVARLREVALSRKIAEVKSTLQRINPLTHEVEYTGIFTELVTLEAARRVLHDLALGEL
jgi:DNA primase